jgi:hypothetical protein
MKAADRQKFTAILSRLDSPFDGEVIAAAHAARRFLDGHGLSWGDIVVAPVPATPPV